MLHAKLRSTVRTSRGIEQHMWCGMVRAFSTLAHPWRTRLGCVLSECAGRVGPAKRVRDSLGWWRKGWATVEGGERECHSEVALRCCCAHGS